MTRVLFLFVDGIGLGEDDPETNAFSIAEHPTLRQFTRGRRWLAGLPRTHTERGSFVPTDAGLGVVGRPQSATGQAAILTGLNVPEILGRHYGPKPDALIGSLLHRSSIFRKLVAHGRSVQFLNAYPPRFFAALHSGKRLPSATQLAALRAGIPLRGLNALVDGQAVSADFTGEGWHTELGYKEVPLLTPHEAGVRLARLALRADLSFFDHWVPDMVGHRGTLAEAVHRVEALDAVIAGILSAWDDAEGLVILTSDHGNMEDMSARGHTLNQVPTLIAGAQSRAFAEGLTDLRGFARRIIAYLTTPDAPPTA